MSDLGTTKLHRKVGKRGIDDAGTCTTVWKYIRFYFFFFGGSCELFIYCNSLRHSAGPLAFGLQAQSRGCVKLVGVKGWFDDDDDDQDNVADEAEEDDDDHRDEDDVMM